MISFNNYRLIKKTGKASYKVTKLAIKNKMPFRILDFFK